MYGGQTGGIGSAQAGPASAIAALGAKPVESTLLEQHLNELSKLNEVLAAAFQRTCGLADRLIGPEPQPPAGAQGNGINEAKPPMFSRLEGQARIAAEIAESVHRQLNRLERL